MSSSGDERSHMKLKDKAIAIERERERTLERETTQELNSAKEITEHFSHPHPLVYSESDYQYFVCNSCAQSGRGKRYHCSQCNFDLHEICANSPLTWLLHHMPSEEIMTSGVRWDVIRTFAHPNHDVTTDYMSRSFNCDHCNNSGKGLRFCCDACNVEFHQACAQTPTRLTSYLHPQHELELKLRPFFETCKLCGTSLTSEPMNNRMYSCKNCKFYVHPQCSQWPLYLVHPLHPPHPLVLNPCGVETNSCSACMGPVTGKFKYSCNLCELDFDLHCVCQQSKLGLGEEVRRNNASRNVTVLPVTNLSLPNKSQNLPAKSSMRSVEFSLDGIDPCCCCC